MNSVIPIRGMLHKLARAMGARVAFMVVVAVFSMQSSRAGTIFDDDWTPPKPVHQPPVEPPKPAPRPAPQPALPAPQPNPVPQPGAWPRQIRFSQGGPFPPRRIRRTVAGASERSVRKADRRSNVYEGRQQFVPRR